MAWWCPFWLKHGGQIAGASWVAWWFKTTKLWTLSKKNDPEIQSSTRETHLAFPKKGMPGGLVAPKMKTQNFRLQTSDTRKERIFNPAKTRGLSNFSPPGQKPRLKPCFGKDHLSRDPLQAMLKNLARDVFMPNACAKRSQAIGTGATVLVRRSLRAELFRGCRAAGTQTRCCMPWAHEHASTGIKTHSLHLAKRCTSAHLTLVKPATSG